MLTYIWVSAFASLISVLAFLAFLAICVWCLGVSCYSILSYGVGLISTIAVSLLFLHSLQQLLYPADEWILYKPGTGSIRCLCSTAWSALAFSCIFVSLLLLLLFP